MKLPFLGLESSGSEHGGRYSMVWLILGFGAILRFATLGRQSLWLDEGMSYWLANRSWQSLLSFLPSYDPHPPLHYLILQPMIALGGDEWLLRLPSALASVVSIGLILALGKELFDEKTALMAAFIIAISPFHLRFAQEARMYAVVVTLSLAAGLFAVRALRTNHWHDWFAFGLFQGLALLADTAAIWFTLAVNTAWLVSLKKHWNTQRFWPWLAAQLFALLLFLPWFPNFMKQFSAGFAGWIPPATLIILARTLTDFIGSYEERSTLESIIALVVLLMPLAAAPQLIREASSKKIQYLFLVCWFVVPIGLAFLISQPYIRVPLLSLLVGEGRSVFLTRNLILASIPLYLLLSRSITLSPRHVRFSAMIILVAMSGISYYTNIIIHSKEDYRTAAQLVRQQAATKDLILFAPPYLKIPFSYYWDRSPFIEVSLATLTDGVINGLNLQSDTGQVKELIDSHQRVWLIINPDNIYRKDTANLKQVLDTQGRLLQQQEAYGVSILLYLLNNE
jgi:uncharacterized membrane protein